LQKNQYITNIKRLKLLSANAIIKLIMLNKDTINNQSLTLTPKQLVATNNSTLALLTASEY
jgi:hypothetical protein